MLATVAAIALGVVLLLAGVGKLADRGWATGAAQLGVPAFAARIVPALELALGALLISGVARNTAAWVSAALLLLFTVLLMIRLAQGRRPPCACFGVRAMKPIGPWSVVRNVLLMALAVVVVVA
jgi:uncharacterized membrane protein YphA (DoxX/SURF4 family)